jgi:chromosome segregation ATPase
MKQHLLPVIALVAFGLGSPGFPGDDPDSGSPQKLEDKAFGRLEKALLGLNDSDLDGLRQRASAYRQRVAAKEKELADVEAAIAKLEKERNEYPVKYANQPKLLAAAVAIVNERMAQLEDRKAHLSTAAKSPQQPLQELEASIRVEEAVSGDQTADDQAKNAAREYEERVAKRFKDSADLIKTTPISGAK